MKYQEPIGAAEDASYLDADPAAGVEGSAVPASAIEHGMREIINVIIAIGLTPTDGDLTQLWQALLALRRNVGLDVQPDVNNLNYAADLGQPGLVSGIYYVSDSTTNKPAGVAAGSLLVLREHAGQASYLLSSRLSDGLYLRRVVYGVTTPWVRLVTAAEVAGHTETAVITGGTSGGSTLPLPNGFTESHCRFLWMLWVVQDTSNDDWLLQGVTRTVDPVPSNATIQRGIYQVIGVK